MAGGGNVGLYHGGSRKFTTLTDGIGVTGNVSKTTAYMGLCWGHKCWGSPWSRACTDSVFWFSSWSYPW